jgi:hypothetical protein
LTSDLPGSAFGPTIGNMVTGLNCRYPRSVAAIRLLVIGWLVALTGLLLSGGYWGWALVTIAGAVANLALAYRVSRSTRVD